ncbi:MAG: class I SAM-dependent methyltransferase, partial [Brevundimonas sp.]|nr:class I SAM-dependent methyltransferase [Brevundimonas sp.]
MTTAPDRHAAAAREVVAHIAEHLEADLSVQLWDGSIVPLGPNARDDIRLVISSPKAIRRLLLKPGLMTVFELYGAGEL